MPKRKPYTTDEVIAILRDLEAHWPKHLMLFGGPHMLSLIPRPEAHPIRVVANFSIPASGGDPDWL